MTRRSAGLLLAPLLLTLVTSAPASASTVAPTAARPKPSSCTPSPTVLHAAATPVHGLSPTQVRTAAAVINAAAQGKVPQQGQTLAVMTALAESDLGARTSTPVFGDVAAEQGVTDSDATGAAQVFYRDLVKVPHWQQLPPTLAAHAAQHNLDPGAYAAYWQRATTIVNALTAGTGTAGLENLAARAQAVADCTAASVGGQFALGTRYVGPVPPDVLVNRAQELASSGGGWHDRCQHFVAVLDGRASSGFSTALDAWQTFLARGVAHPVTSADGVAPPVGAWLYYQDSTNPAGHVTTYLGSGKIASTDVFGNDRVGIGPASAITDGPWRMQYLGWAPPWGQP